MLVVVEPPFVIKVLVDQGKGAIEDSLARDLGQ